MQIAPRFVGSESEVYAARRTHHSLVNACLYIENQISIRHTCMFGPINTHQPAAAVSRAQQIQLEVARRHSMQMQPRKCGVICSWMGKKTTCIHVAQEHQCFSGGWQMANINKVVPNPSKPEKHRWSQMFHIHSSFQTYIGNSMVSLLHAVRFH